MRATNNTAPVFCCHGEPRVASSHDLSSLSPLRHEIGAAKHVDVDPLLPSFHAVRENMSQPPARPYAWTYAEYARFPDDGNRYEVMDGEILVTPAPSPQHQRIAFVLAMKLEQYVERQQLGVILPEVDLLFATGQFLRPDLLFVPVEAFSGITDRGMELAPGLIVEILSPTSSSIDRVMKPRRYADFGVPEYWVVDPEARAAWLWRFAAGSDSAERVTDRITWRPPGATESFALELTDLWSKLLVQSDSQDPHELR